MKPFTFWAALLLFIEKVLATGSPQFICNSEGIKRYTNHTSSELKVHMKCPSAVQRDATVEISCEVMSKTFAVISWFYNGQQTKQLGKTHVKIDDLSCQQKLKIKHAMTTDSGNYTCTVTNDTSTITKTCHLEVKASKSNPVHIEEPKISGGRKKACLGGSVNLICNMLDTEGIFWKKDGHEIRSERHAWKQNHTHGARGVKFYLEITNVTKSDEGFYECDGIKNGLTYTSTKKLFLGTEPCPHSRHSPLNGNQALPISNGTSDNRTASETELDGVSCQLCKEREPETALVKNRGYGAGASNNILISSVLVVIKTQTWN